MSPHMQERDQRPEAYEEEFKPRVRPWWVPWLVALLVAVLVIGIGSYFVYGRDSEVESMGMGGGDHAVPPVTALYAGEEIRFIHTEASDPEVAGVLSEMMGSPVIVVRSLAEVPGTVLGDVYVFENGVQPDGESGPFGFQPDVFDTIPGDAGYTPLRSVNLVTWREGAQPRTLRSAEDVLAADQAGEVEIAQPGIVVNMPVVDWPGGGR